jgi:LEA14-like dessication related protein
MRWASDNEASGMRNETSPMVRSLILPAAAALTLVGCAWLQRTDPPQVTVVGVEPSTGEGLEARMQLKLRVQNPNDAPIEYNGIYLELDVQNKSLASGVSNQSGTVPAFGEAVISVPVAVSYFGIAGQAMGLLSGKSFDKITYEMRGKLSSTTSGTLRFKSQGELNVADLMTGGK